MDRGAWGPIVHRVAELDMTEWLTLSDAKYSSNALDILQIEGGLRIGVDWRILITVA